MSPRGIAAAIVPGTSRLPEELRDVCLQQCPGANGGPGAGLFMGGALEE